MMRRISLSIIFGFIFPFACLTIIAIISVYIPQRWMVSRFYGQPAPGIIVAPFALSVYASIFIEEKQILPPIIDIFWFRIISLVLFNWWFYGTLIYFILGRFKIFKKKSDAFSKEPPRPPLFLEDF